MKGKQQIIENTLEIIKSRRSTRTYKTEDVSEEQLNQIIEAGRFAPSGENCQSTHFIVIKNKKILAELANLVQQDFSGMEITPGKQRNNGERLRNIRKWNRNPRAGQRKKSRLSWKGSFSILQNSAR